MSAESNLLYSNVKFEIYHHSSFLKLYLQDLNFAYMAILFGKTNMNCKKISSDAHAGKLDSNFTYTEFVKLAEFRSREEKIAKIPNNYSEFSFFGTSCK